VYQASGSERERQNDPKFFRVFSERRQRLEQTLVDHKSIIATILQASGSKRRVEIYAQFIQKLIDRLEKPEEVTGEEVVALSGLTGKVFVGTGTSAPADFSEDVKSETFIRKALECSVKCPICGGYLDPEKSLSYDHIVRKREGGDGGAESLLGPAEHVLPHLQARQLTSADASELFIVVRSNQFQNAGGAL
jgi:hypothetical protein